MTYTYYDALLDLARIVGSVRDGSTTSASTTTTAIDSLANEPNDWYNDGTIWIPEITYMNSDPDPAVTRVITDYASATHTYTFAALPNALGGGVNYSATNAKFPLYLLKQSIKAALQEIGPVISEKTFTSDGSQAYYAYTYSGGQYVEDTAAEIDEMIIAVDVSSQTTAPYDWQPNRHWHTIPYLSNGHKGIEFFEGFIPAAGEQIRLIYSAMVDLPSADADIINPQIHPDLLKWTAAVFAWRWRLSKVRNDEPEAPEKLKEAQQMAGQMAYRHKLGRAPLSNLARW